MPSLILVPGLLALMAAQPSAAAGTACPPQPLPSAIDAVVGAADFAHAITFAATPSFDPGGRAWVVRLSRRGDAAGSIQIMRLRRQRDCNRYDVENRWEAPLRPGEYNTLTNAIAPVTLPTPKTFIGRHPPGEVEIVLDGTGIELRQTTIGWEVRRSLNHYAAGGAAVSGVFHEMVAARIPASEVPAPDWRTKRRR
jgi:hypothetical protein